MLKKILLLLAFLSVPYAIAMDPTAPAAKKLKLGENPLEESFEMVEPWQRDLDIHEPLLFSNHLEQEDDVTITTQDGRDFKVPIRLAKLSETIKNLIEDAGTDNPIPLPTVNAQTWHLIQSLLEWVFTIRLNGVDGQQIKNDTRGVLQELTGNELVDFIMAVNYLDISLLLDMIIDIVKQGDSHVLSPAQIAQLPKDIRNPIILAHSIKALAPFQGQQLHVIKGHKSAIDSLCMSSDGSKVFSTHRNGMMRSWDIKTGEKQSQFGKVTWGNVALCLLPDDTKAILGFWGKPMRTWDLVTNQEITEGIQLESSDNLNIRSMLVTPDGTKIVSCLRDSTIVWDIETCKILTHYQNSSSFCSFCITPDSSRIVTSSQLGTITIHDSTTGEKLGEFKISGGSIHSGMVTLDGTKIVLLCGYNIISVRDITNGTVVNEFAHDKVIRSACLTQDGSMIVLGLLDGAISICDILTGKEIMRFGGHKIAVTSLCVTGTHLISASDDNTLRIWNLALLNPLLGINAQQAYHIWDCLQKNDLVQCKKYVQTIIVGVHQPEQPIPSAKSRKPLSKRHKVGE